jgi:hypothetical protein
MSNSFHLFELQLIPPFDLEEFLPPMFINHLPGLSLLSSLAKQFFTSLPE